jgi:hypothetical protein
MDNKPRILISIEYVVECIISKRRDLRTFDPKLFENVCKDKGAYFKEGYVDFDKLAEVVNEYLIHAEASATARERILTNTCNITDPNAAESQSKELTQEEIDRLIVAAQGRAKDSSPPVKREISPGELTGNDRIGQGEIDDLIASQTKIRELTQPSGTENPAAPDVREPRGIESPAAPDVQEPISSGNPAAPDVREPRGIENLVSPDPQTPAAYCQTSRRKKKIATEQLNYVSNLIYAKDLLKKVHKMPDNRDLFNAFRAFCHHDKGLDGKQDYRAMNNSRELLPRAFIEEAVEKFADKIYRFCEERGHATLTDTNLDISDGYVSDVSAAFMGSYA